MGPPPSRRILGSRFRAWGAWLLFATVALLALPYLIAPFYRVANPVSTLMLWRSVTGRPVERTTLPLSAMGRALPLAVLASEDARFCSHAGVDWKEMRAALAEADDLGDARGGSTITQQVAKNLFLWQGHSFLRKGLELPLALWLDFVLPKRRILEIYLNIAEWGPEGQFGAVAGARRAFGKSVKALTAREAALLAVTLPNPHRRNPARAGPSLRRLAGIVAARAHTAPQIGDCLGALGR